MRRTIAAVICVLLAVGCGSGTGPHDIATTTSTGSGSTSEVASVTSGETTNIPTTGGDAASTVSTSASSAEDPTGSSALPDVDDAVECDVLAQDCADGMKCAPYAEGGASSWNANKCVPVLGDQLPGEPCTAEGGGVTGLDDCIEGALCWDVNAMNTGTCIELCHGSVEDPMCPPDSVCSIGGDGVLNICLPSCEPLSQDCASGDVCLPIADGYVCVQDVSGDVGAVFDPCEYANACDPGLLCLAPAAASECAQDATGCCLPMCPIDQGGASCPGSGQMCLPVYESPPAGDENVGYCSLMP